MLPMAEGSNRSTYRTSLRCHGLSEALVGRQQSLGPAEAGILRAEAASRSMWVSHLFLLEAKDAGSQEETMTNVSSSWPVLT